MTPQDGYRAFHAPRYRYLLNVVERYLPVGGPGDRVLDVGLSPFTEILRRHLGRLVDTLGLEPRVREPFSDSAYDATDNGQEMKKAPDPRSQHFQFDLNALADSRAARPALPRYGLIVFAEVIEHLHTSPLLPLTFFRDHLVDGGCLVVQTPNAASLGKRLKLLAGLNPYEMIRDDRGNPGHFREYTARELRRLAARAGFTVIHLDRRFYFDARHADHAQDGAAGKPRPWLGAVKNVVYSVLPPFLREGMTAVLRREPT
jgi:hypothetical protein